MADTVTDTDSSSVREAEDGKEEDRFSLCNTKRYWRTRKERRDVYGGEHVT